MVDMCMTFIYNFIVEGWCSMAKLYFRYGAMNSGKSTLLMQVAYNYEENNRKVLVIKSKIDTKGEDTLVSRIGLQRKVDILRDENESLMKYKNIYKKYI